jgi:Concanavalin A-like lectin/glucanases superfamily
VHGPPLGGSYGRGYTDFLRRLVPLCAAISVGFLLLVVPRSAAAGHPLVTAVVDEFVYSSPDASLGFERTRKAGARMVRLTVPWDVVAPKGREKPRGFDASDPADPAYDFAGVDRKVRLAVANRLQPVLGLTEAPLWAQDQSPHPSSYDGFAPGPYKPSPVEVARFARALARRYGGSFQGLPRVRYWHLWNEPNLIGFLSPQFENGRPFAPIWYRGMLNAFAGAVHAVHRDNVVIAGSLAPFSLKRAAMGPLQFIRSLLCMSKGPKPKPVCAQRASLDALAVHPYTSGGPTHHALNPNDVSLGDLPEVQRVLAAAVKNHRVLTAAHVALWVTEFSWDTRPADPNPLATPFPLQARWTAEALYRMWKARVGVVTWFLLRDQPWPEKLFQSGLYFRSGIRMALDQPKPTLTAFRFPFVTFRRGNRTFVWGRTPNGRSARVILEQRLPRTWRQVGTIRADRYGIFTALLRRRFDQPKPPAPSVLDRSYAATVLADRPTSYWRLGEQARAPLRDLVGARPAAASGGVKLGTPGALLDDKNTAVKFNGTNGRIDLGVIRDPLAVELWVKTRNRTQAPFFSNRDALHRFLFMGSFLRIPQVFDAFTLFGATTIADGRWHHVVFTYSGVTGKIYVDGRLEAKNTWIRSTGGSDASLGYDVPLDEHLAGSIDEVAVYDHVLTTTEVQQHFRASRRTIPPDPDLGALRARLAGSNDSSIPFPLTPPPDRYVQPFGG